MHDDSYPCHSHGHSGDDRSGEHGCDPHRCRHGRGHWCGRHDGGPGRDRAPGTEFLHLELSSMLRGMAQGIAEEVIGELLRDAIKQRLRERLGHHLDALADEAADRLGRDFETNLAIETLIAGRKEQRSQGEGVGAQPGPAKRRARR